MIKNQMNAVRMLRPTMICGRYPSKLSKSQEAVIPAVDMRMKTSREKLCWKIPTSTVITAVSPTGLVGDTSGNQEHETNDEIRAALYKAVQGINRGLFGVTSAKKSEILELVELLESRNPTPDPTDISWIRWMGVGSWSTVQFQYWEQREQSLDCANSLLLGISFRGSMSQMRRPSM